jgi:O-antigen/teichoic acid export membrane protein
VGDLLDTPEAERIAARGALQRVAGHAAGVAISVLAAALLFRHLGVADAGRYVVVTSLATVAVQLADAGLTSVATRELALRGNEPGRRLLDELLGLRLLLAGVGVGAAVVLALVFGWGAELVLGAFASGIGAALVAFAHNIGALLGSRLRWGAVAAVDIVRNAASAATVVVLVAGGATLAAFFAAPVAGGVAALILTLALTRARRLPRPRRGLRRAHAAVADLLPLALAVAVTVVYLRTAMIVTSLVASPDETGTFAAAFRVVEVAAVLPALVFGSLLPVFVRAGADRARHARLARRSLAGAALAGFVAAAALVLAAPLVIDVVGGAAFARSTDVLRIEAIAFGLSFVTAALTCTLLSLRRHRAMLAAGAAGLGAVTAATALLAPAIGAAGSALACIIGELIWLSAAALLTRRSVALARPLSLQEGVA